MTYIIGGSARARPTDQSAGRPHKIGDLEPGRDAAVSPSVVSAVCGAKTGGSTPGLVPVSTRSPAWGLTLRDGPARHAGGMNIYLINALLVLLVLRQIREHQLDLRALAVPVLAVGAAAVMFLHSVPGGGSDIALDLLCLSAGAAMGAIGGLATQLRLGADGRPLGRAGTLAAGMWIAGVGARMVFYFAATHGAGPAIAAFSIAHHITGPAAWTAALVMMALADVLTRLAVVWIRGRRLTATATPAIAAPVQAGAGA